MKMKKSILGFAFLMMAAFAGNAASQCPNEASCPDKDNCKKELCDKKDCKGKDCSKEACKKSDCKQADCKGKPARKLDRTKNCDNACQFEGLNLTEEQKVKIQDLDNAMKASRAEMRADLKENKDKAKFNFRENEKNLRTKYLDDLQKILSGEQYVQFLQNFYVNQLPGRHPSMKDGFQKFERRADRMVNTGKLDIEKSEKAVVKEAKKIEKDAKKVEKKRDKKR